MKRSYAKLMSFCCCVNPISIAFSLIASVPWEDSFM